MTTPYYGTVMTEKAHGKTLHEQMRNTTGQGFIQYELRDAQWKTSVTGQTDCLVELLLRKL